MRENNILILSVVIVSVYMIYWQKRKVQKRLFIKLDERKPIKYNCFLQPPQRYIYIYNGTIQYLNKLLEDHSINYIILAIDNIYHCTYQNLEFEIRLFDKTLEFIPIVGPRVEFDKLINCIIN